MSEILSVFSVQIEGPRRVKHSLFLGSSIVVGMGL